MEKSNIFTVQLPVLCESSSFCITKQQYHLQIVVNDIPFDYDSMISCSRYDVTGYSVEYSNNYIGSTAHVELTLQYKFGLDCVTMNNNLNVVLMEDFEVDSHDRSGWLEFHRYFFQRFGRVGTLSVRICEWCGRRCMMVLMKKGNYTFSVSGIQFIVPIDSIVPSRNLSSISVFNATGEEINHSGEVITAFAGESLTLVAHLVDEFGVEVNAELLQDSVVLNVISYEDGSPVGFQAFHSL